MVIAPAWIEWALREVGVKERVGPLHHPRVLFYHSFTRLHARTDEVPWCASFVGAALASTGFAHTRSAAASSYATYGAACGLVDGAIIVFGKSDPDAKGTGHVGFLWQGKCLGGNQRNLVSLADRDLDLVVASRWPVALAG